ncbi:MAG: hypothetical protein JSV43_08870 [Methanobacteriota archaeon]|nr:MAG: hypothetical protein JSV43_08870 [Euryarchaeota archaeon]
MTTSLENEIIYKMFRRRSLGGVHKSKEDIQRWFRKDLRGAAKQALDRLVRLSLVVEKPTSYGRRYCLNRDRLREIKSLIEEYLE